MPGFPLFIAAITAILAACGVGLASAADAVGPDIDPVADRLPDARSDGQPLFSREVAAALTKAGCNSGACHGSFQGRGGLQLSLLGFDPAADYESLFKAGRGRRVFPAAPEQSLLLLKATGSVPHGGGKRISPDSAAYDIVFRYIAAGLSAPQPDNPQIERLNVEPAEAVLQPGQRQSLRVTALWSDGSERDVTPWALFDSRDQQLVEVTRGGTITANKAGKSPVTVRYLGQVAAVSVTIPYAQSPDEPSSTPRFETHNYIDELVAAQWRRVGVEPAPLANDYEFVRRIYLDLIGTLPTPAEVSQFAASQASGKRRELIDALLERPEYVDYWALKWGDLLRVHRRYVGEKGLGSFWGWVRQAVRENRPLDQITRELLTAQGNLFTHGPVAYYFVDEKPEDLAETTSQVFLGVRLQCTRCHHHPQEVWSQQDYYGLAAFFTRLETKDTGDQGRLGGARVIRAVATPSKQRPLQVNAEPRLFGQANVDLDDVSDVRVPLANWITRPDNPYFARNFANRFWAYLMGRGLVEPIDDLRATNPPSNPELLDALAQDLVGHDFDVKHLMRTICNSRVYQLASEVSPARDQDGMFYTHRQPRRMPAEVMLDAVNQVAGTAEKFAGVPEGTRAIALPDPSIPSYFLSTFGRPLRNDPCECARSSQPDLSQALHLVNSTALNDKIAAGNGRLAKLLKQSRDDASVIEQLYLAALGRRASAEELREIVELLSGAPSREVGLQDLLWTLLNSSEFVFNH